MKRHSGFAIIAVALACALSGCQTQPSGPGSGSFAALSREQLVEKINANNQKIPTLWARINLRADIRNPDTGKRTTVYADHGYLFYRAPGELRLRANKDVAGLLLDLGINSQRYWVIAPDPGPDTMWWGNIEAEPQRSEIPLRPQDMLEILAIRPIDVTGPDAPKLQYSQKDEAYMLIWYRQVGGRYFVSREIFYDAGTLLPKTVLLFAADGSLALRAKLSNHGTIVAPSKPEPRMAREYELLLPESRSRAELRLLDLTISREGVPNDASFRFPEKRSVAKEKQIDAHVPK